MITALLALAGWGSAAIVLVDLLAVRRASAETMKRVARADHELRGPITAARLGLQLGARSGELSPALLRAIDLELGRAALALEDLSAAGSPVQVRRQHGDVDLGELLEDSVESHRLAAAQRGVELALVRPAGPRRQVRGDRVRLAQAIGNLVANAIEHGGGRVEVLVRIAPWSIRVEITDRGPGLPAPVSELTRRAGAGRRRGHGLAIAAAIAAEHGGRVAAAPCQRGARLVLELPRPAGRPSLCSPDRPSELPDADCEARVRTDPLEVGELD